MHGAGAHAAQVQHTPAGELAEAQQVLPPAACLPDTAVLGPWGGTIAAEAGSSPGPSMWVKGFC